MGTNYLHYPLDLAKGQTVEVTLDNKANVRLLDEANFSYYKQGHQHRYIGGYAQKSPVRITAPRPGKWNLVVDLGGYPGIVRASVKVLN